MRLASSIWPSMTSSRIWVLLMRCGISVGSLNPIDHQHFKIQFLGPLLQQRQVAFAVAAEGVIVAHDHGAHAHAAQQQIFHELPGGDRRELPGKRNADQNIDARFGDQFGFLIGHGDHGRMTIGRQHPHGMRVKGHGHGRALQCVGFFDDRVKKSLMADMNAIKIADGDNGFRKWIFDLG